MGVVDEAEAKSLDPGEDGDEKADNDRDDDNDGHWSDFGSIPMKESLQKLVNSSAGWRTTV